MSTISTTSKYRRISLFLYCGQPPN